MNWSDPDSDPIGDMRSFAERMGAAGDRIATMLVPRMVGLAHGFQNAEREAQHVAREWGFRACRVIWSPMPPVPFKRNKRTYR